jgi:AcrR family transcriptional regulator
MVRSVTGRPEERDPPQRRNGGRARNPELDEAIAQATRELLERRGIGGLTIEAIARQAGVGRATVYRRWSNRDALLAHLLRGLVREPKIPDHGDVRSELIELLSDQLAFLQTEAGKLYPSLGAHAATDPAAAEALQDLVLRRRTALQTVLERGVARQQIRNDVDPTLAYCMLWGPVYYRYLAAVAGHAPIEPDFTTDLVDRLLAGLRPAGGPGPTPTAAQAQPDLAARPAARSSWTSACPR